MSAWKAGWERRVQETALFAVHGTTSRPKGYVDIAANQALHLIVSGLASAGRRCVIEFNTEFAAQGRYLLKGGIADSDSGWCRVGLTSFAWSNCAGVSARRSGDDNASSFVER